MTDSYDLRICGMANLGTFVQVYPRIVLMQVVDQLGLYVGIKNNTFPPQMHKA